MNITQYTLLISSTIDWFCPNCLSASLPFSSCSDTSFQEAFADLPNSSHPSVDISRLPSVSDSTLSAPTASRSHLSGLLFNARSVRNKGLDLATSIASSTPPDILALTETWLKEHDSDAILGLPDDYLIFRKDRPSRGGGILTAVKANLHPVHHAEFDSPDLELLWVSLSCQRGRCLLCTLYRPPCATTSFWDDLNLTVLFSWEISTLTVILR